MSDFKMKINQVLLHLRKRCLEDHGKVQREEWRTEWTKNQVQWQQNQKERKKEFIGKKNSCSITQINELLGYRKVGLFIKHVK